MPERLYICRPANLGPARLVVAVNAAQAYRHLARSSWSVEPASAIEVARIMQDSPAEIESAEESKE